MRLGRQEWPGFLVSWCSYAVPLHPWGVRTALVPPRGERSEGASVRARGGTHPRWWPLVASSGVTACRLPGGLRDLLGPWLPVV